jgi:hypothetical protein
MAHETFFRQIVNPDNIFLFGDTPKGSLIHIGNKGQSPYLAISFYDPFFGNQLFQGEWSTGMELLG